MLRVAGVILAVAFYIYCIIDVARTPRGETRNLPKFVWLILVVLVPLLGGAAWLFLGRVWQSPSSWFRRSAPLAPDDDPKFLKQLDDDVWAKKMQRRRDIDPAS